MSTNLIGQLRSIDGGVWDGPSINPVPTGIFNAIVDLEGAKVSVEGEGGGRSDKLMITKDHGKE
jgi:hypothetical protein